VCACTCRPRGGYRSPGTAHLEVVLLIAHQGLDVGDLPAMVHHVEGREAGTGDELQLSRCHPGYRLFNPVNVHVARAPEESLRVSVRRPARLLTNVESEYVCPPVTGRLAKRTDCEPSLRRIISVNRSFMEAL